MCDHVVGPLSKHAQLAQMRRFLIWIIFQTVVAAMSFFFEWTWGLFFPGFAAVFLNLPVLNMGDMAFQFHGKLVVLLTVSIWFKNATEIYHAYENLTSSLMKSFETLPGSQTGLVAHVLVWKVFVWSINFDHNHNSDLRITRNSQSCTKVKYHQSVKSRALTALISS